MTASFCGDARMENMDDHTFWIFVPCFILQFVVGETYTKMHIKVKKFLDLLQ
jgi:hypothetical protein